MKTKYFTICILLIIIHCNFQVLSQEAGIRKINTDQSFDFKITHHDPSFLTSPQPDDKSFYQRKSEWKHIIDTTWGQGAPLEEKLKIYTTYSKAIRDYFAGFKTYPMDWDSLYNHYLIQITDSTSKGAFSSIMSHFAFDLNDYYTWAFDEEVVDTTLSPGMPILIVGTHYTVEHFGAVTTVLEDSSTLVLRVAPNHPLNLEPGDIILGYEGVPWPQLLRELLNGGLPMIARAGGCKTADIHHTLMGAGMNWHLFNTIDILKHSSGETVHLSLKPMVEFKTERMVNNEQLPVENIPFPRVLPYPEIPEQAVTYGIYKDTNIGYIYLSGHWSQELADNQFFEAVDSLKNTEALIIDMRLSYGGWALFYKAFKILFNESQLTLEDLMRCDKSSFELCLQNSKEYYDIHGSHSSYYDRPIAVLLGPGCETVAEMTPHRLKYHPMVRFFGASITGTMAGPFEALNFPGWQLYYNAWDLAYLNDPETPLNKKEFPIDFPVWFNKEDVAKGIDPIVEKAVDWINNLPYGHSIALNKSFLSPEKDTINATAIVENPESHELMVKLIIESLDSAVMDSVEMEPINANEDKKWQGIIEAGNLPENFYWLSVKVEDKTTGTFFTNRHMTRITTVPLVIDSLAVRKIADYSYSIQPYFKNEADAFTIEQYTSVTLSANPWVKAINPEIGYMRSLKPGQTEKVNPFRLTCDTATFQNHFDLKFMVANKEWPFWVLDTTVTVINTSAEDLDLLPLTNNLEQNYPNPFNAQTSVKWQLSKAGRTTLSVYDILGRKVTTPVDEYRLAGRYETKINASTLPKGIYFYQLKAGKFIQTRKMIVEK